MEYVFIRLYSPKDSGSSKTSRQPRKYYIFSRLNEMDETNLWGASKNPLTLIWSVCLPRDWREGTSQQTEVGRPKIERFFLSMISEHLRPTHTLGTRVELFCHYT